MSLFPSFVRCLMALTLVKLSRRRWPRQPCFHGNRNAASAQCHYPYLLALLHLAPLRQIRGKAVKYFRTAGACPSVRSFGVLDSRRPTARLRIRRNAFGDATNPCVIFITRPSRTPKRCPVGTSPSQTKRQISKVNVGKSDLPNFEPLRRDY